MKCNYNRNPTIFIVECVLGYLEKNAANAVLNWISTYVDENVSILVNYEPCNPSDRFGKIMVENLAIRGCPLRSVLKYPTMESLKTRFHDVGFSHVNLSDMLSVYNYAVDPIDRLRIEVNFALRIIFQNIELFDELEEWRLIQTHYYLAVCTSGVLLSDTWSFFKDYWSEVCDSGEMPRFSTSEARSSTHSELIHECASRLRELNKNSANEHSAITAWGSSPNMVSASSSAPNLGVVGFINELMPPDFSSEETFYLQ